VTTVCGKNPAPKNPRRSPGIRTANPPKAAVKRKEKNVEIEYCS
jgi:hypothetical protein